MLKHKLGSEIFFGGLPFFSHGPTNGVHILDLVLESTMVFFSQCLQNL